MEQTVMQPVFLQIQTLNVMINSGQVHVHRSVLSCTKALFIIAFRGRCTSRQHSENSMLACVQARQTLCCVFLPAISKFRKVLCVSYILFMYSVHLLYQKVMTTSEWVQARCMWSMFASQLCSRHHTRIDVTRYSMSKSD